MRNRDHEELGPATALGREWVEWLSEYPVGAERLARSLTYVKDGAVDELKIDGGTIEGKVWGSQPAPYQVVLQFSPVDKMQWDLVWSLVNKEAMRDFSKGLVGHGLRSAMAVAEVNLLPDRYKEIRLACSCPDWMRPCKHALAVLRVLGTEVDREPMLLVRLRGGGPQEVSELEPEVETGEALRAEAGSFWGLDKEWGSFEEKLLAGGPEARLLKRLGPVAVYGVRMDPDAMFKPVYEGVAAEAKVMIEGIRKKIKK